MSLLEPQGQGLFKFCISCQCHERTFLYFLPQTHPNPSEIFKLLSSWVKNRQIPHVTFEATSPFSLKLRITLQYHER